MQLRARVRKPLGGPRGTPPLALLPGFPVAIAADGQDTGVAWWGRGWRGG